MMWRSVKAIEGVAEACEASQTPIVSGNVGLSNETDGRAITPTIGMVGIVHDVDRTSTRGFRQTGNKIVLSSSFDTVCLGDSELVLIETTTNAGRPADSDFERAAAVQGVRSAVRSEGAQSAPCIQREPRTKARLPVQHDLPRQAFGQEPDPISLSVSNQNLEVALSCAATHGAPAQVIGETRRDALNVENDGSLAVTAMTEWWANGLQRASSAPEATAAS